MFYDFHPVEADKVRVQISKAVLEGKSSWLHLDLKIELLSLRKTLISFPKITFTYIAAKI